MPKSFESFREEFVKTYQAKFEIHPTDLGIISDYWLSKFESYKSELIKDIEGMKMETKYTEDFPNDPHAGFTVRQLRNKQVGYNPALKDIISLINNK